MTHQPPIDTDITRMLQAASSGGGMPSEDLLPLVYDELRRMASADMRHEAGGQTLQPTALVHEAWLRLAGTNDRRWNDRAHFFRTAAQVMRRILVDRARQKSSLKRDGGARIDISDIDLAQATQDDRVLLINEALEKLEKENPQSAQIITMKFFGGLTNREIVESLGIPERSVERRWTYAKARLFRMLRDEL
ncbi:MAG: sigma-70 family RNA polymerase sigma factor [Verrucomicrobiaceae bacterium]|nr:MAG: sigma-70 family RNA polymerase sigma factor [Verrucomicrobiaceae bacterium]